MKTKTKHTFFGILSVCICLMLFSSCTVHKATDAKIMKINGAGVIQKPVVVDLMVGETKVTGHSISSSGTSLDIAKDEAVSAALKSVNADVLVEPTFSYESKNSKTEVTVVGWPANYINFRSIKADDIPLLEAGTVQDAKIYKPAEASKKKGGSVIGIISLIVLAGVSIGLSTGQ